MSAHMPKPSSSVEVIVDMGSPNYWAVANSVHGFGTAQWWVDLGDLLGGRPGWRCELTSEGLAWKFGPMGTSLLVIAAPYGETEEEVSATYEAGTYELVDYDTDATHEFSGTGPLREWLDTNEARHAEHVVTLGHAYSEDNWAVIRNMGIDVRVTHDGDTFIATVPYLLLESTFAVDLPTLLAQARELIAHAFDAPAEIAPQIKITAGLDAAAVIALA